MGIYSHPPALAKLARVRPDSPAISMARLVAAPFDTINGRPTVAHLRAISDEIRPVHAAKVLSRSDPFFRQHPIALSRALCLPISSKIETGVPPSKIPAE